VSAACGMEVVQQQCSSGLSNDLQYKNVKAIFKAFIFLKNEDTQQLTRYCHCHFHLGTGRQWYTSFKKHLVCWNYIHSFSPSGHFVCSTPPSPLPCLFASSQKFTTTVHI